ncbi:recombination associated protein [Actinobacillus pleuropneumoniae]|nr:recombinase RdgC [Actinobacillus pleuropneumoniae]KIE93622.1 recombination associated protein [Actinobacillus pleuropneumoniae]KIE99890.1 recombinase RdgC [Actinobacillus pleuropneumoniae]
MFWFKNVMIYRLTSPLSLESSSLEEQLQQAKFSPCSQSDMSKFGWSSPLSGSELLHFSQGKQFLLVSHKEDKLLPANVIKKETEERIAVLEEKEAVSSRKPKNRRSKMMWWQCCCLEHLVNINSPQFGWI